MSRNPVFAELAEYQNELRRGAREFRPNEGATLSLGLRLTAGL